MLGESDWWRRDNGGKKESETVVEWRDDDQMMGGRWWQVTGRRSSRKGGGDVSEVRTGACVKAPIWYVPLWELYAYTLWDHKETRNLRADISYTYIAARVKIYLSLFLYPTVCKHTHGQTTLSRHGLDLLMHVHMSVSLLTHSLACERHAYPCKCSKMHVRTHTFNTCINANDF